MGAIVALLLALALFLPGRLLANHQQQPGVDYQHWKGNGKRVVKVITTLPTSYDDWVLQVLGWWRKSNAFRFKLFRGGDNGTCTLPKDGYVKICQEANPRDGGNTQLSYNDRHVVSAVARINMYSEGYFLTTLCHEFGHALGLLHQPESSNSCLSYPVNFQTDLRPNQHDYRTLRRIQHHKDNKPSYQYDFDPPQSPYPSPEPSPSPPVDPPIAPSQRAFVR
ncbi:MAG: hypothetical protein ACRDH6_04825 [Actinomycetota bacterium]